jgi:glycoside/pentoside/hexuronide:cation symporter, GPH family
VMTLVLYRVYLSEEAGGVLNREGYAAYGILAAIVISLSMFVSALGTHKEIPRLTQPAARPVTLASTMREIRITLTNRSLLVVLLSGLLGGIGSGLSGSLSQFFYLELWQLSAVELSNLAIAQFVATLAAVGLAPVLSRRFGKKNFMMVLFAVGTVAQVLPMGLKVIGVMPPNSSPWLFPILFLDSLLATTLIVMGYIIVSSMVADVVEDVAVETGVRSEGLLFAANGLLPKFTAGIGVFLSGVLLTRVDFPIDAGQGEVSYEIMRSLVVAYLPVTLLLGAVSLGVLSFYRIDRSRHEQNLERLDEVVHLEHVGDSDDGR